MATHDTVDDRSGAAGTTFSLAVFDVAGTTVIDGGAVVECLMQVLQKRIRVSVSDAMAVMGLPKPVAIRRLLSADGVPDTDLDRPLPAWPACGGGGGRAGLQRVAPRRHPRRARHRVQPRHPRCRDRSTGLG